MDNMYYFGKNYILTQNDDILKSLTNSLDNDLSNFIRGYLEFNYKLIMPNNDINNDCDKKPILYIYFRKEDKKLVDYFLSFINDNMCIKYTIHIKTFYYNKIQYYYKLIIDDIYVIKFLSNIYNKNIDKNEIDEYLYNSYLNLSNYRQLIYDAENENIQYILPKCTINIINKYAIIPPNINVINNIYEISIVKRVKHISDKIIIYDTGLQIIPQFGFYFTLIPTNKLSISGYILTNNSIIDNYYYKDNNTLLVTLIKLDKEMPDLKLPFNCCNLVLNEMINYELKI